MRLSNSGWIGLVIVACLSSACDGGCGASSSSGPSGAGSAAPAAESAQAAASGSAGRHVRPIRVGGLGAGLFRAVTALELGPEQRAAYDKIGTDLREGLRSDADAGAAARAATKETHTLLAAGMKAGKFDTAKLDAQRAIVENAAKERAARELDALNKLHALLEPDQRAKIVAAVRADEEKRAARVAGRDGGAPPSFARGRMEAYTRDLQLDAAQAKKVDAIIAKEEERLAAARDDAKKQLEALLAAFEKDGFDARKILSDAKVSAPGLDEQGAFLVQLAPVLTQPQRDKLAAKLEKPSDGRRFPRPPHDRHAPGRPGHDTPDEDDDGD